MWAMQWGNVEELYYRLRDHRITPETDLRPYYTGEIPGVNEEMCVCGRVMKAGKRTEAYVTMRCNFCDKSKRCHFMKNNLGTSLSNFELLRFLFFFSLGLENKLIVELTGLSEKTVSCLVLKIQQRMSGLLNGERRRIGGPGHLVQLDESCFGRRKYNVGRTGGQMWVFGGIDTTNGRFFMRVVRNRTVRTLGEIISQQVRPGTMVHTDQHRSYISFFRDNPQYGYDNVNHTLNFVNQETGAHTQHIENLWGQLRMYKRKRGCKKHRYLQMYLDEFSVRKRYCRHGRWKLFELLLNLCF